MAITLRVIALVRGGLPLSVTMTVIEFVLRPALPGTSQLNCPFVALMLEPVGAPGPRLKLSCCAGMSGSVAVNANESDRPFVARILPVGPLRTGGVFVARDDGFAGSEP